jgi:hypothetical protein
MNRSAANRYELSFKQHESMRQDFRQERKSEGQRLDRLKQTLQTRIHIHPTEAKQIRAALATPV